MSGEAKAADDAESIEWLSANDQRDLAFDHNRILNDHRQWGKKQGGLTGHQKASVLLASECFKNILESKRQNLHHMGRSISVHLYI